MPRAAPVWRGATRSTRRRRPLQSPQRRMFFDRSWPQHPIATCTPTKIASVKQLVRDTITRFVPFSPEVCVTVSRRPVLYLTCALVYLTCALVFLFLTAPSLQAQKAEQSAAANPIDPKTYGGMKWRLIGPFRGGRVLAVTGVPSQPNTYYFGAVA